MSLSKRMAVIERTAGTPRHDGDIETVNAYVEHTIASIARRSTDDERAGMGDWWACCRKMVATDPAMAKIFAGFLPSDLDL